MHLYFVFSAETSALTSLGFKYTSSDSSWMALTSGRGGFLPAAPSPAFSAALALALSFLMMESCWLSCSSLQKKYPAFQYVPLPIALDACLYLPVMNVPYVLAFTPITFWNEVAVTLYFWRNVRILPLSACGLSRLTPTPSHQSSQRSWYAAERSMFVLDTGMALRVPFGADECRSVWRRGPDLARQSRIMLKNARVAKWRVPTAQSRSHASRVLAGDVARVASS